jgi:hypothetical protein
MEPRDRYLEYVDSLSDIGDLEGLLSYEEWLEEELKEMWTEYGSPYLDTNPITDNREGDF